MITCIDFSKPRKYFAKKINENIFNLRMASSEEQIKTVVKVTETTLFITLTLTGHPVMATTGEKVIKACQPIIELIQSLGYPVCLCVMTAGAVTMAFNRKKGLQLIKDGAIAYIVIQFVPIFMRLLAEVGGAMK